METLKGHWAGWLLALASLIGGCANPALMEERDYARLDPPRPSAVADASLIEVTEFIWFGCPHCADMHPRLQTWLRNKPADVRLTYRPAVLTEGWAPGARLHHTLEALGELENRAGAVFEAVQLDDLDLASEEAVLAWATHQGLDPSRFTAAYRSDEVHARTAASAQVTRDHQVRGVPTLVVDGKYLTSNRFTGSAPDTLKVLDRLIVKVREEKQGRR